MKTALIANRTNENFEQIVQENLLKAQSTIYLATGPIRDFVIGYEDRKPLPFSEIMTRMSNRGIKFFILTADVELEKLQFYKEFKGNKNVHFAKCLRNHSKMVIIDEKFAYIGSANIIGAAMGKRKPNNINFELGVVTENKECIQEAQKYFLEIFSGKYCENCKRKKDRRQGQYCPGIYSQKNEKK